jgi:transcriptional regulator with XRE-family HTH domain
MITFGENILLWRLHRSLSQERLAKLSNLPRPNVSDIEKGKRDLANALDVSPGTLVNGEPPGYDNWKRDFSRAALERIACSVVQGAPPQDPAEHQMYDLLKEILQCSLQSARNHQGKLPQPTRKSTRAWLYLRALCSIETINSLVNRTLEEAERQWIVNK